MEVIKELSGIRVDSSTILNTLRKQEESKRSRGLSLAITALEKGRMYLGEVQGNFGQEFPYEATKKATTAEGIQKAVEVSDKVDQILEVIMNIAENRKTDDLKAKFLQDANIAEAYRSYKECRMWLGIRLGEIKDNA